MFVYVCFLVRYYYVECTDFMYDSIKILDIRYIAWQRGSGSFLWENFEKLCVLVYILKKYFQKLQF